MEHIHPGRPINGSAAKRELMYLAIGYLKLISKAHLEKLPGSELPEVQDLQGIHYLRYSRGFPLLMALCLLCPPGVPRRLSNIEYGNFVIPDRIICPGEPYLIGYCPEAFTGGQPCLYGGYVRLDFLKCHC